MLTIAGHVIVHLDVFSNGETRSDIFKVIRPVEAWTLIGVNAVSQDRFQLALHSSTEQQALNFAMNPAAVHWCLVSADL